MKKIKLIIFDFDNTLYQGEKTFRDHWTKACIKLIDYFFKDMTENEKRQLYKKYNVPYQFNEDVLKEKPGIHCYRILTGEGYTIEDWLNYWSENVYLENWDYITKTVDNQMLKDLQKDYALYIVTNSPTKQIKAYAKELNIDLSVFKHIYANFETRWRSGTTKEVYYKDIIQKEQILPKECLVIGDSYSSDLRPAIELGMNTLLVDSQEWDYNNIYLKLNDLNK